MPGLIPIVVILFTLIVCSYLVWSVPKRQVRMLGDIKSEERLKLENEARKILAEILGGGFVLIGLLFTWETVRSTAENLRVSQEGLMVSQENLRTAQASQTTDQFTKAIEQLGKVDEKGKESNLAIRFGGIRGLERLAETSIKDYWPIMEILTTYVREHAKWQSYKNEAASEQVKPKPDIQAILNVLGNRSKSYGRGEDRSLDLGGTDLRRANLVQFNFNGVNLSFAHLESARLKGIKLQQAILTGANFGNADLEQAQFDGADLAGANLSGANLTGAIFGGTKMEAADFSGAILNNAELIGVDLRTARNLTRDQLKLAKIDHTTKLPDGQ